LRGVETYAWIFTIDRVKVNAMVSSNDRQAFDDAIVTFRGEVANVAAHGAIDARARITYNRLITAMAGDLGRQAASHRVTWAVAAEQAHAARNNTMTIIRARSSPVGRALAERVKREGRTLNGLIARKTLQIYGVDARFDRLTAVQKDRVYRAIVEAAGRADPRINRYLRSASAAARGLLIASLAYSIYAIATSANPGRTARREGALLGSGVAGGIAGGALAGLACGPGAPVYVTVGAFVGGALAATGVGLVF
jgi:hypothetical protein